MEINDRSIRWDYSFLKIAKEISTHSTCCRKQVGSILVNESKVIISMGYNGVPSGMQHCNEHFTMTDMLKPDFMKMHGDFSRRFELHSEQNCIAQCAKNGISPVGSTLYIDLSPCSQCAKLILAAGIKRVVYSEEYDRETEGLELLRQNGVKVDYFPLENNVNDSSF